MATWGRRAGGIGWNSYVGGECKDRRQCFGYIERLTRSVMMVFLVLSYLGVGY